MVIGMAEFLENVSKMKKREEKVDILKRATSFALRTILQGAYDPKIKWLLPTGIPPYKPNDIQDQEAVLLRECRKLSYFVEGGSPVRSQSQREMMFIELLENVSPADAKLLCSIKEKKLPYKGITADIVKEAFPNLILEEITN